MALYKRYLYSVFFYTKVDLWKGMAVNVRRVEKRKKNRCKNICKETGGNHMRVEEDFKVIDHYLCICMPKEVDHHNASGITQKADEMICKSEVKNLIFDFSETEFMDSSGIALILRSQQRMQLLDGNLLVCNVPEQARRVLDAAGIARLVTIR